MLNKLKCPKCNERLLTWKTKLPDLNHTIVCVWCGYESKEYSTRKEAIEKYETEIL